MENQVILKKVGKFQGKSGNLIKGEIIQGKLGEFYFGTPWYFCNFLHFTCLNYLHN